MDIWKKSAHADWATIVRSDFSFNPFVWCPF